MAGLAAGVGMLDVLIGACAIGRNVALRTFNVALRTFNTRHFHALTALVTEQPDTRP